MPRTPTLGLRVAMETDRSWGSSGLERKGSDWVKAVLKRVGKRTPVEVTLHRNNRWELTFPGGGGSTVRLAGRLYSAEVTTAYEPAEETS